MSLLDIAGWIFHLPLLTSVLPHYATMKPNTALCLLLIVGAALLSREQQQAVWGFRKIVPALMVSVAFAIAFTSFLEYILARDLGIDQLFLWASISSLDNPTGRMAVGTAVVLMSTAIASLLRDRLPSFSVTLFLAGTAMCVASLFGFIFQAGPLAAVPSLRSLAVHTDLSLLCLQIAGLASRPYLDPVRTFSLYWRQRGQSRTILYSVTIYPLVVAIPVLVGMRLGQYDAPFALALLLTLLLVIQTFVLWVDTQAIVREVEGREAEALARAQVQLRLETTADRLQLAQTAGKMAAWEWEVASGGLIWDAGSAWTYGRAPEEMNRISQVLSYLHPEDRGRVELELSGTLEGGAAFHSEFRVLWPDGSVHWNEAYGVPVRNGDGTPTTMVGLNADITERKSAADALIRSEKLAAVGRLASSIAHEINNPLAAVTNLLYLARNSQDLQEAEAFLVSAESELRRAANITNQTLKFNRHSTKPAFVTFENLIEGLFRGHHGKVKNAGVEILVRSRATKPVPCFEGEIRQVLSNLIGNAIDAMQGRGGRLLLRSRDAHDWRTGAVGMIVTIADTGIGMPAEIQESVFEAFFTTKGVGGSGLGLWISKDIIERHSGRLLLRSSQKAGHSGTVFTLFLPSTVIA